jgi:hypothetical protein
MNGAIADPCTRTINPPNTNSNSTMGASQYFLRTRMNSQSSLRNDMDGFLPRLAILEFESCHAALSNV